MRPAGAGGADVTRSLPAKQTIHDRAAARNRAETGSGTAARPDGQNRGMTVTPHPLDPLSAAEITAAKSLLAAAGHLDEPVFFAYLGLEEPPKAEVLASGDGDSGGRPAPARRARAMLVGRATGRLLDLVLDLGEARIDSCVEVDTAAEGHAPILLEEFDRVESFLNAHPEWIAALARRGVHDMSTVRCVALSAGHYGYDDEAGRRIVRSYAFLQDSPADIPWAHPVDGLVAYVDIASGEVLRVIDEAVYPVPATSGNYEDPALRGPDRTTLKPIAITQPEGPSFTLDGHHLSWEGWTLRIGFDAREGLTLHDLAFTGPDGRRRPVVYRASVAEMVVPYADPSPVRSWQNYFDTGEYRIGALANSLVNGCDCLGEIRYLDAVVADSAGDPLVIRNAVCIHEEDTGIQWKHTDMFTGMAESRRGRKLVISYFSTVGNYDYGFYWSLALDGTIELEAKLTGYLFTSAYRGPEWPYASEVAPGLGAPYHQHLFSARLDMTVDGPNNAVDEIDAVAVPRGPGNAHGNAFTQRITRLTRESEGVRSADAARGRVWRIVNPERTNGLGHPVSYVLTAEGLPTLLADPDSSIAGRAEFATKHLWVTRYDPAERYSAGDLVNQHPGGAGLPAFAAADRDIDGQDIVLWHTFGLTHFPRPEDWPVMPVDRTGFTLRPHGFFDRNPTLDLPPETPHGAHAPGAESGAACCGGGTACHC